MDIGQIEEIGEIEPLFEPATKSAADPVPEPIPDLLPARGHAAAAT